LKQLLGGTLTPWHGLFPANFNVGDVPYLSKVVFENSEVADLHDFQLNSA
jgi:hypothetical protein